MDTYKKETVVNFTCHDLNARCVSFSHGHRRKLKKIFIRQARRKNKNKLKKMLDIQENT